MRAGYASGERDAALARRVRGDASMFDMFAVGPQLHMLEGAVQVTPEQFAFDEGNPHSRRGKARGEGRPGPTATRFANIVSIPSWSRTFTA